MKQRILPRRYLKDERQATSGTDHPPSSHAADLEAQFLSMSIEDRRCHSMPVINTF